MDLSPHEVSLLRQLAAEDGLLVGVIGEALTEAGLVRLTPHKNRLQRAWLTDEGRAWLAEHAGALEVFDALVRVRPCHDALCNAHVGHACRRGHRPNDCPMATSSEP